MKKALIIAVLAAFTLSVSARSGHHSPKAKKHHKVCPKKKCKKAPKHYKHKRLAPKPGKPGPRR